jgi:hypothetical protein
MSADPQAAPLLAPRRARPHAARLLIEIPYRQAGLIALFALAGVAAALAAPGLRAPARAPATRALVQAQRPRVTPVSDAVHLQMDLDPETENEAETETGATALAAAATSPPSAEAVLRLDDSRTIEELLDEMRTAPAAAGPAAPAPAGRVVAPASWPGLLAGLLLGLVVAGVLELRGGRMRTAREAEWALGVPVLGALPTLSARARAAGIGRATRPAGGAPTAA